MALLGLGSQLQFPHHEGPKSNTSEWVSNYKIDQIHFSLAEMLPFQWLFLCPLLVIARHLGRMAHKYEHQLQKISVPEECSTGRKNSMHQLFCHLAPDDCNSWNTTDSTLSKYNMYLYAYDFTNYKRGLVLYKLLNLQFCN